MGFTYRGCISSYLEDLPYPVIISSEVATFGVLAPAFIFSARQWAYDINRYKMLYPVFWVVAAFISLISKGILNFSLRRIDEGWFGYMIFFTVPTVIAILMYISFFLILGLLETTCTHIGPFIGLWMVIFLTTMGFIYGVEKIFPWKQYFMKMESEVLDELIEESQHDLKCFKVPMKLRHSHLA